MYYLNARYYDPVVARFISEDTYLGQASNPLSLNLYTYCSNEPVMYVDPTGHEEAYLVDLVNAAANAQDASGQYTSTSVSWDPNIGVASVTVNGITQYFSTDGKTVIINGAAVQTTQAAAENGHFILDNNTFNSMFSGVVSQTNYTLITSKVVTDIQGKDITASVSTRTYTTIPGYGMTSTNHAYIEGNAVNEIKSTSDIGNNKILEYIQKGANGDYSKEYRNKFRDESPYGGYGYKTNLYGVYPYDEWVQDCAKYDLDPSIWTFEKYVNTMGPIWEAAQANWTIKDDIRNTVFLIVAFVSAAIVYTSISAGLSVLAGDILGSATGANEAGKLIDSIDDIEEYIPTVEALKAINPPNSGLQVHHILPEYLGKQLNYSPAAMLKHPGILIPQFTHTGALNPEAFHKVISKWLPYGGNYTPVEIYNGLSNAYVELGRPELFEVIKNLIM